MSLILDALNRADQERSVENSAPNLQSAYASHSPQRHPIRRWIIEAVIIIAAIAVGIYGFQQLPTPNHPDTTARPATPAPAVPSAADSAPARPTAASKPPPVAATDNRSIDALYQQPLDNQPPPASTAPAASKPAPAAQQPVDTTQAILASIPLLTQQSLRLQRAIPSIEYSMHVFAEQGGFVVLNGKRLRVGDQLAPQLRVIAILKNSLVLDYNSRQFRLMALNSWISL